MSKYTKEDIIRLVREGDVEFIRMLRPEIEFPDLDSLQAEIHRNCLQAQAYFEEHGQEGYL